MARGRPLSADEQALWQNLIKTVKPLDRSAAERTLKLPVVKRFRAAEAPITAADFGGIIPATVPLRAQKPVPVTAGLDRAWDRKLAKGAVQPDVTVDLHGHTLTTAHNRLDHALELSIAADHRAILLITGKPRSAEEHSQGSRRGAIRAAVTDWLAASRHAGRIATVRGAHPRHGGNGALYIILRRRR